MPRIAVGGAPRPASAAATARPIPPSPATMLSIPRDLRSDPWANKKAATPTLGVAALGASPWLRGSSRTPPSLRAEPHGRAANAWISAWRVSGRTLLADYALFRHGCASVAGIMQGAY